MAFGTDFDFLVFTRQLERCTLVTEMGQGRKAGVRSLVLGMTFRALHGIVE